MKLYKRQLKSIEDLKRERVLLEYVKGEHDAADLFSMEGLKKGKKAKKNLSTDDAPSNGIASMLMGLAGLGSGTDTTGSLMPFLDAGNPTLKLASKLLPKKQLKSLFWEIVTGYLKWRAVEGGIWLVKKGIANYKEKKRFAQEAEFYDPRLQRRHIRVKKKKLFGLF